MKFLNLLVIILFIIVSTLPSCKEENQLPTCNITSPENGIDVTIGDEVVISVDASDNDGSIAEVRFIVDETIVFSDVTAPFSYNWATETETAGSHTIVAKAYDDNNEGTSDEIEVNLNEEELEPVAAFSATPTSGELPLTVSFSDESLNNPERWEWDFGDGTTSSLRNPSHTYDWQGIYTVVLTVENSVGSSQITMTDYIEVLVPPEPPVALFYGTPTSGEMPLEVTFIDASTGVPDEWNWDFGDGETANTNNPTHTFTAAGIYTVTLSVTNIEGSDTEIRTDYITVTEVSGNTGDPCPGTPTMTDIDGNVYNTVIIGNQCWMKENLKVTHYPNGEEIPYITDNGDWAALEDNHTDDAFCYSGNDLNSEYGALYTYAAAIADDWEKDFNENQGICPDGWHMPKNHDWSILEAALVENGFNWDGSTVGDKVGKSVASSSGWKDSDVQGNVGNDQESNNASGFSALPGGCRNDHYGMFNSVTHYAYWWAAEEGYYSNQKGHKLSYKREDLGYSDESNFSAGYSIRCVRDY